MQEAELPGNEARRLSSLYSYGVLDSEPETAFDELTELAARVCGTPIALISLLDETRQWFKSRLGLSASETARNVAFCSHAILQPGLFIVPDTLKDKRFADNPLVTGEPRIRFYAGAPLLTADGCGLGTLCVIDQVPRELTQDQLKTLSVLRTHVLKLFELRRVSRDLDVVNRELEEFSYSLSHDLRAPLRAVSNFSRVLLEDHISNLNLEGRSLLRSIVNSVEQVDQMSMDLASLSRLFRHTPQYQRVDVSKLAHEVLADLRKEALNRRALVTIQPGLVVRGDPVLLRFVIEQLLGNAWKFTSKCEEARIEFGFRQVGSKKEYYIQDNGVGFEMAYADRLFHPFQRMHTREAYAGVGVGLAAVKSIIQRHGGTVRAESAVNLGTTIHFTLAESKQDAVARAG